MAKSSALNLNLPPLDDLFSTQESRDEAKLTKIHDIPLSEIDDFPDHPFQVKLDADMDNLVAGIRENGVFVPVILRKKEDGRYELVSGHRRKKACGLAGLETIRAEVQDLTRDEAIIKMVDSNLQRSIILPSEKAFSYKMRLEAMNRQGQRTDLTCAPSEHKLDGKKSRDLLAEKSGESREQVRRYIRLTNLLPELLQLVDDAKIALRPAVELSYLFEKEQHTLYDTMCSEDCTPSHAQAINLRQFSQEGHLNPDVILSIMQEEKPNQKEQLRIPKERISKYFPAGTPAQKIEDTIIKALELYRKRQRDQERRSNGMNELLPLAAKRAICSL